MRKNEVYKIMVTGLLCAISIVIPLVSPFKIVVEPASFTLGSHVAIMIAMFISPMVATAVTIGSVFGFFFGGFPIIVVLRALSHLIFAFLGALYLKKFQLSKNKWLFSIVIALIHALCETITVSVFYFGVGINEIYYTKGFLISVILLVGMGTIIHSLVDFEIAYIIWKAISKNKK